MYKTSSLKRWGVLTLVLMCIELVTAQKNYIPGYVISSRGDTLRGLIDYRNWEKNPDKISFKASADAEPLSYTPLDISQFTVADEIYYSGIVPTLVSHAGTSRLSTDPVIHRKVDTTFLQALFRGDKSLFYFKNQDGVESFYITGNQGFELLLYKRYLRNHEGGQAITENKTFTGQLALYLDDCHTIQSKLQKSEYDKNSLTRLFKYYYGCSDAKIEFEKVRETVKTEIGVIAGASLTTLNFSGDYHTYLVKAPFKSSLNFTAGMYFNFVLPRNQGKWAIYNELMYLGYGIKGTYEKFINENNYTVTHTEMNFSYLKINNLVRYQHPFRQFRIFVNAGISNGFQFRNSSVKETKTKFYAMEKNESGPALGDFRKYEFGPVIGAGAGYGSRYTFEIRYETGSGISPFINLGSNTRKIFFLLGYKF